MSFRQFAFQLGCIAIGVVWVIAGEFAAASSWLAASVIISQLAGRKSDD